MILKFPSNCSVLFFPLYVVQCLSCPEVSSAQECNNTKVCKQSEVRRTLCRFTQTDQRDIYSSLSTIYVYFPHAHSDVAFDILPHIDMFTVSSNCLSQIEIKCIRYLSRDIM